MKPCHNHYLLKPSAYWSMKADFRNILLLQSDHPADLQQLLVGVTFGQSSEECENYGICRMDPVDYSKAWKYNAQQKSPNKAIGVVSLGKNKKLEIAFLRASMTQTCQEKYFGRPHFQVDEHFVIPPLININDQKVEPIIYKGQYLIQSFNGFFVVAF